MIQAADGWNNDKSSLVKVIALVPHRRQAITRNGIDQDLRRHMLASLCRSESMWINLVTGDTVKFNNHWFNW